LISTSTPAPAVQPVLVALMELLCGPKAKAAETAVFTPPQVFPQINLPVAR
jgi:hypothetical protein